MMPHELMILVLCSCALTLGLFDPDDWEWMRNEEQPPTKKRGDETCPS